MDKETFDRMIEELQYITEKTNTLREFILNQEKFEALDFLNRDLLIAQCKAMETYLSILSIRLGINGKPMEVEGEGTDEDTSVDTETGVDADAILSE